ncbi:MAG: LysE family translocator [Alphaproteobacteria bacterium]|nr:LysE family translocator [Alphaproteobacteria bacterium]
MDFSVWLAFFAAAAIVIVAPGPSTLLVVAHGLSFGRRPTMATILGVISADSTHVVVAAFGLTALLAISAQVFTVMKWVGVAYLIYLGIRYWRAGPIDLGGGAQNGQGSTRKRFLQGYLVTLTNPKPILFYVAFFPQFLDPAAAQGPQFAIMGATFVAIAFAVMSLYATFAGRVRRWFNTSRRQLLLNRGAGTVLIGAGLILAGLRRS